MVFFVATGFTGTLLCLLFPGLDKDRLQQVRPSLIYYSIYWTSPTSTTSEMRTVMRGVASPTADGATVSAPNHRFCVSMTAFLRSTIFYSLKIGYHGTSLYSNRSSRVKLEAVLSSICGSNGSVQHADSSLRERVSLCEKKMTHKISNTCSCPIHLLIIDRNPIERHSKDGMPLWRTPHHECCQLEDLKATNVWNRGKTEKILKHHDTDFVQIPQRTETRLVENAKTLLIGIPDLMPLTSICRCSRTSEWTSAFAGSIFDPLTQRSSSSPSRSCPKRQKVEYSSHPKINLGQKQLSPCQTG